MKIDETAFEATKSKTTISDEHLRAIISHYEAAKAPATEQPVERTSITEHPQWPLVAKEQWEVEQVLGKALGYPWYKDDKENFPDATEVDGICTGEHTFVTLAMGAASRLEREAQQPDEELEEQAWQIINDELAKLNLVGKYRTDAADAIWERIRPFLHEAVSVEKIARMTSDRPLEQLPEDIRLWKLELARDAIAAMGFTPVFDQRPPEREAGERKQFAELIIREIRQRISYLACNDALRDNSDFYEVIKTVKALLENEEQGWRG